MVINVSSMFGAHSLPDLSRDFVSSVRSLFGKMTKAKSADALILVANAEPFDYYGQKIGHPETKLAKNLATVRARKSTATLVKCDPPTVPQNSVRARPSTISGSRLPALPKSARRPFSASGPRPIRIRTDFEQAFIDEWYSNFSYQRSDAVSAYLDEYARLKPEAPPLPAGPVSMLRQSNC